MYSPPKPKYRNPKQMQELTTITQNIQIPQIYIQIALPTPEIIHMLTKTKMECLNII